MSLSIIDIAIAGNKGKGFGASVVICVGVAVDIIVDLLEIGISVSGGVYRGRSRGLVV